MKILSTILIFFALFSFGCGAGGQNSGKRSILEKKIEMIKADNQGKPVATMAKILELKAENEPFVKKQIMELYSKITAKATPYQLPQFQESPNRDIKIPANISKIHIKSDYIQSANVMLFLLDGDEPIVWDVLKFNTEKKYEFAPGKYTFTMIVDRPNNDNVYVFKYERDFSGGELYLGEFKLKGKYNNSGSCEAGYIRDDNETCITPSFKIFDNCSAGTHLVEHLCCEEGFNFIMDGKCSRYTDSVENVVCPAGYHEAGKGRCCPKGMMFIDDKCQEPPKEEIKK